MNTSVPQTNGANSNGMSAGSCVATMVDRPRKPRIQPAVLAVENSLFMSVNVLSMSYTSPMRVYYGMFSEGSKMVFFENK